MGESGIACADDARAKTNAAAIVLIIDESSTLDVGCMLRRRGHLPPTVRAMLSMQGALSSVR
jgi:hypothetical protein